MSSGTISWCDEPVKRGRIGEVLAPAEPVLALRSALFAPAVLNVHAALRGLICYRTWKDAMTEERKPTRKGSTPIVVRVTPEEKRGIDEMARTTGNSTSAYLRKVGLGYQVKSVLDFERVAELAKINGDLVRLGGLLKLWLSNDKRLHGFNLVEQRRLVLATLSAIEQNQTEVSSLMKMLVRA